MTAVAVYARVSSTQQDTAGTIEDQRKACRDYAAQHGLTVEQEFLDAVSGFHVPFAERPAGRQAMEQAKAGQIKQLIVLRGDRLGRDVKETLGAYDELCKAGVAVRFVRDQFDDTPAGRFGMTIILAAAEYERTLIMERTIAGRKRRVEQQPGHYICNRHPFGYLKTPEGGLAINAEQAELVKQMYSWLLDGASCAEIARRMREMGVPPPMAGKKPWPPITVYNLLTNPRFTGETTYSGSRMTCPAIIDQQTFAEAQKALARNKLNSRRSAKREYLLKNLVWCRTCGSRYWSWLEKGRHNRALELTRYGCAARRLYGPKVGHDDVKWLWRGPELEGKVKAAIELIVSDPELAAKQLEPQVELVRKHYEKVPERVEAIERRLARLDEKDANTIDLHSDGGVSTGQLVAQLDKTKRERSALQAELAQARGDAAEAEAQISGAEYFLALVADPDIRFEPGWADEDGQPAEPNWPVIVATTISRVWVEANGSLTVEGPGGVTLNTSSR